MPLLDPAIVTLSSPMLVDRFKVRRRVSERGQDGRPRVTEIPVKTQTGIVTAEGANGTNRGSDSATSFTTVTILTKFRLRKQAVGCLPDLVLWKGYELLVTDVVDATNYGSGWTLATASSDKVADEPVGSGS